MAQTSPQRTSQSSPEAFGVGKAGSAMNLSGSAITTGEVRPSTCVNLRASCRYFSCSKRHRQRPKQRLPYTYVAHKHTHSGPYCCLKTDQSKVACRRDQLQPLVNSQQAHLCRCFEIRSVFHPLCRLITCYTTYAIRNTFFFRQVLHGERHP